MNYCDIERKKKKRTFTLCWDNRHKIISPDFPSEVVPDARSAARLKSQMIVSAKKPMCVTCETRRLEEKRVWWLERREWLEREEKREVSTRRFEEKEEKKKSNQSKHNNRKRSQLVRRHKERRRQPPPPPPRRRQQQTSSTHLS